MAKGLKSNLSEQEIDEMVDLYNNGFTYKEIGEKYNISRQLVGNKLRLRGVENKHSRKITDDIKRQVIELYLKYHHQNIISEMLSMDVKNIRKILHEANIKTNDTLCHQKYELNEKYFDNIDTPNKAYILGLLYSDGNLTKKGNTWRIYLQEGDVSILKKILKDIESTHPLSYYKYDSSKNQYGINITNKHMYDRLLDIGLLPAKSLILKYPQCIPDYLQRDFIRGYYDGDGSSYFGKNGKSCYFMGTYEFCSSAKTIIENNLFIDTHIYKYKNSKNTYNLYISGRKQAFKFLEWIYLNAEFYIERKYNKFISDYQNEILNNSSLNKLTTY